MFLQRLSIGAIIATCGVLIISSCSDTGNPVTPPGLLTASPASVTLSAANTTDSVTITGGTPLYTITTPPNSAIATAQLFNDTIAQAILAITRVGTATGPTAVTIKDASPPPGKQVTVPVTVN